MQMSLHVLIKQLLLIRTQDFGPTQTAAFVDGWTSMLELLERVDVWRPTADQSLKHHVGELVEVVRRAQADVLEQED